MATISVIIPTYNRANTLKRAIDSVLLQDFDDFELIIVDDCSTDGTKGIVETYKDSRICYYRCTHNLGASGARNYGVTKSNGEYIAFHDSDDEWIQGKLTKQIKYAKQHPEYGLIYGKMDIICQNERGVFPNSLVLGDLEGDIYQWLLCRNTIGAPTMFLKKEVFENVGGFDDSLRCLEDWEFAIRISKKYQIGYIDDVLIRVYSEPGGVSSNLSEYFRVRCMIVAENRDILQRIGILDEVIIEIFEKANSVGLLQQVKKMLMLYLQNL